METKTKRTRLSDIAQAVLTLGGKPFSLKGRDYLKLIYDDITHPTVLKTARQVEKSTTAAGKILSLSVAIPYFVSGYIAPSKFQAELFANEKLNPFIEESPYFRKYMVDRRLINKVMERKFKNGSHIIVTYSGASNKKKEGAGDRARGFSADANIFDEFQDHLRDSIPIIEESLSHSPYKLKYYAGTPKTRQNIIETTWQKSTQIQWVFKCPHCGYWHAASDPALVENHDKIFKEDGFHCLRCGGLVNPKEGQWAALNPGARVRGIHISQLMVKWISWENIYWEKYMNENYTITQFANEVLGISWEDAERPLSQEDLIRASGDWDFLEKPDKLKFSTNYFMGIDWATTSTKNASTVITILAFDGIHFKVVKMLRFEKTNSDPFKIVQNYVIPLFNTFKPKYIGVDWGVGAGGANSAIRTAVMRVLEYNPVLEFYYSGNSSAFLKWDKSSEKFVMNRTIAIRWIIKNIKNLRILFPKYQVWENFAKDFLSLYVEQSDTRNGTKVIYDHDPETYDDSVHSVTYAVMAALFYSGRLDKGIIQNEP